VLGTDESGPPCEQRVLGHSDAGVRVLRLHRTLVHRVLGANGRSLRAPSHAPGRYVAHRHRQQHLAHRPLFSTRASSAPRHRSAFVVDDGSTDRTGAAARAAGADMLRLPFNLGVGGAMGALPLRPYPWRHLRGSNGCRRPARSGKDCRAAGRRRISGCRGRRPVRRPGQLPRPGTAPLGHALARDAPEQGDRDTADRPHVRISGCRAASYTSVCSALSRGVFGRHLGVVDHRAPSGTQYCAGAGGDAGANYGHGEPRAAKGDRQSHPCRCHRPTRADA